MKRACLVAALFAAAAIGVVVLLNGTAAQAAPPCPYPPPFQCVDVYDPVECLKPGVGWKVYGNACYAAQDCAKRCRPVGA